MEIPELLLGMNRYDEPVWQAGKEHAATALVQAWLLNSEHKVPTTEDPVWEESYWLSEDWVDGGELLKGSPPYQPFDGLDDWCLKRFTTALHGQATPPIYDDGEIEPTRFRTAYTVATTLPGVEYAVAVEITLV